MTGAARLVACGLCVSVVVFAAAGTRIAGRTVAGDSVTITLTPMPEDVPIMDSIVLGLFTASADSALLCGPTRPNPHSWLSSSVICRSRVDFQIVFCTAGGDSIEALEFEAVEPGAYRIGWGDAPASRPGSFTLRFRYAGEVVHEHRIRIPEPR